MTALSLRNVNKSFGEVHVLKDINLDVEEGEFVVFVGPSGCGKSTLLRVIAGLEDATSGDIHIAGDHVNLTPPSKRGIAMVFQSYALYPHLNVRGNMTLALKQEGQSILVIDKSVKALTEVGDRHYIVERGKVVWQGSSGELRSNEDIQHQYLGV